MNHPGEFSASCQLTAIVNLSGADFNSGLLVSPEILLVDPVEYSTFNLQLN